MIIQLIAYRRTGKDYLFANLHRVHELGWKVYSKPGSPKLVLPKSNTTHISFANSLKRYVCEKLAMDRLTGIHSLVNVGKPLTIDQWVNDGWLDLIKDLSDVQIPKLKTCTIRDTLIYTSKEMKSTYGDLFFVDQVRNDVITANREGNDIYVTDTRFPYEIFPGSTTVRLFRSDVPIPDEESETSLDQFQCDYLLCKTSYDFEMFSERQEQYRQYIYCHELK